MAGDPLRDAFRAQLDAVIAAASPAITWLRKDTTNTTQDPDVSSGYFDLEFPGGSEGQYTFGAPGSNLFREIGQVTIRVCAPLGANRDLAETYASQVRIGFRSQTYRSFAVGSRTCRITETAPMGDGEDDAGMWSESIALGYELFNIA